MPDYRHRIETTEAADSYVSPQESSAGMLVAVGTAPVHMAKDPSAAVNEPIIAYSFAEAKEQLGYSDDFDKYTLCQVMDNSFRKTGVGPVVFINVLDPATHATAFDAVTVSVVNRLATVEQDGILEDGLVVKNGDTALVKGTDYTISYSDEGYLKVTILMASAPASVTVSGSKLNPAGVTKAQIIGGYNVTTGKETGIEAITKVFPKFGLVPGILSVPKWSSDPEVAAVIAAKVHNINGVFNIFSVVDIDTDTYKVYTGLNTARTAMGVTDPDVLLLWPKVKKGDTVYDYSAVWPAVAALCDADHGDIPYKNPSNEDLGASAAVLNDGTEVLLDFAKAELVNSFGIATAINFQGWKAWGDETAAYPGATSASQRYIASRRMLAWLRNHFVLTYCIKVDEAMNPRLIESVVNAENEFLNGLAAIGAVPSGTRIMYDEAANTLGNMINGEVTFYIEWAAWPPAKHIVAEYRFIPELISNALTGGAA